MTTGTVLSLHRWPVKSFRGEDHEALDLDLRGVPGDRAHAVWLKGGKRATARVVPGPAAVGGAYDARVNGAIPAPRVDRAGRHGVRAGATRACRRRSRADLGRDVDIVHDPAGMQDLPNSILVTFEATRARLEEELGEPVDLRRFRTNVHVDADAGPFAEAGWEGRTLRIGDAELELLHPCLRCSMVARDPDTNAKSPAVLKRLIREHGAIFGINARPRERARRSASAIPSRSRRMSVVDILSIAAAFAVIALVHQDHAGQGPRRRALRGGRRARRSSTSTATGRTRHPPTPRRGPGARRPTSGSRAPRTATSRPRRPGAGRRRRTSPSGG